MLGLLVVKSAALFAVVRLFNGTHTSLKTALLLAQCGEFSFVVFETAQSSNLFVNPQRAQLLIMAIVMIPLDGRVLDGAVHAFNLPICPRVVWLC